MARTTKGKSNGKLQPRKRVREALWLSAQDSIEIERLKREFGVKTRPAVLRRLFLTVKLPTKRRKK